MTLWFSGSMGFVHVPLKGLTHLSLTQRLSPPHSIADTYPWAHCCPHSHAASELLLIFTFCGEGLFESVNHLSASKGPEEHLMEWKYEWRGCGDAILLDWRKRSDRNKDRVRSEQISFLSELPAPAFSGDCGGAGAGSHHTLNPDVMIYW